MRNILSGQGSLGYINNAKNKDVIVMNNKGSIVHDKANGEFIITYNYPTFYYHSRVRIVMADKNLGATQIWNEGDPFDEEHCGKWYQWGNCYGFPYNIDSSYSKISTTAVNLDTYYDAPNTYSSDTWHNVANSYIEVGDTFGGFNLWGNGSDHGNNIWTEEDITQRRGPCASGYHLQNRSDRLALQEVMQNMLGLPAVEYRDLLKIPNDGCLNWDFSKKSGPTAVFWGADNSGVNKAGLFVIHNTSYPSGFKSDEGYKSYGAHIRPFKNITYDFIMTKSQLSDLGDRYAIVDELNKHIGEYIEIYGMFLTVCVGESKLMFYVPHGNRTTPALRWAYYGTGTCS